MLAINNDLIERLGLLISIALLVIAVITAVTLFYRWIVIRNRRRDQILSPQDALLSNYSDISFDRAKDSEAITSRVNLWVHGLLKSPKYGARVRQKLVCAGIFSPNAVGIYILSRFALAIVFPFIFLLFLQYAESNANPVLIFGLPIAIGIIGLFVPEFYISRRTTRYEDECRRGFPDFLDLLVVATDAGLGLEQAISRVGGEVVNNFPLLGSSILLMSLEMRMGSSFSNALNNFVFRSGISEIRNFVTLLQQSSELGASVSAALRIYSDDMRNKRMSMAEEKAHALPVKMVIPLAVFLFPVIAMIVMLPVIVRMGDAFSGGVR